MVRVSPVASPHHFYLVFTQNLNLTLGFAVFRW
jgi:hypothetical protein